MDPTTPVKRRAEHVQALHNPHFKPLWEPATTVGGNAITYSLAHHSYQEHIANAGMCTFCTDELTCRVSEAARRLKAQGLFHDDEAHMDLFWQDTSGGGMSVADHATELAGGMPPAWRHERCSGFQGELAAMDRAEAAESQGGASQSLGPYLVAGSGAANMPTPSATITPKGGL
ncbi:hypothetical protein KVR01_013084 [Diaporthe batatas]|uniref:uncharacterized protein n=1 Tax=Diaporthe batatas TaxID=748121 RepID=UPI001D055366|nr:uncharacterized protein KVR01_013084 [Diaporthe batatas]KAG8157094.1 hypothetical protein KVR01_013084 [Diaporthe batatas]